MIGRLRRAAPWPVFLTLVLGSLAWAGPVAWTIGGFGPAGGREAIIANRLLEVATIAFAVWRGYSSHPFFHRGYRNWLSTTPWSIDDPLPFGPIELDWPDALILGGLVLLHGLFPGEGAVRILAIFFFFHGLVLTISVGGAANNVPLYASLFGLGLMVRLWSHPWACATTGVVVYLILYDGVRIALRAIPESMPGGAPSTFVPESAPCGWPYDRLLREPNNAPGAPAEGGRPALGPPLEVPLESLPARVPGTLLDYLMWSLLLGWWLSCIGANVRPPARHQTLLLGASVLTAAACMIGRISIYTVGYSAPISFWGRLRSGPRILPKYDAAILAIFLIPIIPLSLLGFALRGGAPWQAVGPLVPATSLFLALAMPPGLRRWRLVGRHRMVAGRPPGAGAD